MTLNEFIDALVWFVIGLAVSIIFFGFINERRKK